MRETKQIFKRMYSKKTNIIEQKNSEESKHIDNQIHKNPLIIQKEFILYMKLCVIIDGFVQELWI